MTLLETQMKASALKLSELNQMEKRTSGQDKELLEHYYNLRLAREWLANCN